MEYSKFTSEVLKMFYKTQKDISHSREPGIKTIYDAFKKWDSGELEDFYKKAKNVDLIDLNFTFKVFEGEYINIFLDSGELFKFLTYTPIRDIESVKKGIIEIGQEKQEIDIQNGSSKMIFTDKKAYNYSAIVHIPNQKKSIGIDFTIKTNPFNIQLFVTDGEYIGLYLEKDILKETDENFEYVEKLAPMKMLALNLVQYMSCFPESIIDAPPNILCTYKKNKKGSIKIKTDECLIENRGSVTPHFRRGFFKLLKSDFFKNKKGQIVFVKSTFVKGKAKTVEQVENMK